MPSLPTLPAKNASLRDSAAINVLYNKATREYLTRDFASALATLHIYRSQELSFKTKCKGFSLYIAVLDSITGLDDAKLKMTLGREGLSITEKLKTGTIWQEAEDYFGSSIPGDVAANMILSLTRHMTSDTQLQNMVEAYLTSLDPESALHESVSELYALHVLPRGGEWEAAKAYIENCELPSDQQGLWLDTLSQIQTALEENKKRQQREAEDKMRAELDAKRLRKLKKSRSAGSKKSSASTNGLDISLKDTDNENDHNTGLTQYMPPHAEVDTANDHVSTTTFPMSSLQSLSKWSRSITYRFSPRLLRTILFLTLLLGATGRREIRDKIKAALRKAGSTVAAGFRVSYI